MLSSVAIVLACLLPYTSAGLWGAPARRATPKAAASNFVGSTTSFVFPPPSPTNAGSAFLTFFPDASEVGFPRPHAQYVPLILNNNAFHKRVRL